MTAISDSAPQGRATETGPLQQAARAMARFWAAYVGWRIDRLMAARLRATNYRRFEAAGADRSQIEDGVEGGLDRSLLVVRRP